MRLSLIAVGSFCIALGVGAGCDDDDDFIDEGVSTGGVSGTGGTYGTGGAGGTGGSTAGAGGAGGSTAGTGGAGGSTGGTGGSTAGTGGTGGSTVVVYAQVQPIFAAKCTPCHSAGGIGAEAHTLADSNADAKIVAAEAECMGTTYGACTLIQVRSGNMPLAKGCTGNPAQDASNPACLTQAEQDLLAAWIAGGLM
jgi:hypothetical protein